MSKTKAKSTKLVGFGLVRDKNGKPKIDDYKNCPKEIKDMLTKNEIEEFEKCL
jgi:hypothetical protein